MPILDEPEDQTPDEDPPVYAKLAESIRALVQREMAPLQKRVEELEERLDTELGRSREE